ncbi:MAG TPA: hypothetical protein VN376_06055 [Longilinea sp.]|nr:hypothetical protein [Longilinea sp.]
MDDADQDGNDAEDKKTNIHQLFSYQDPLSDPPESQLSDPQLPESLLQLSDPQLPESLPEESHQLPESLPEEESHQLPESLPEEESHQLPESLPDVPHQESEEVESVQLDEEVEPDPSGLPITQQPMTIKITPMTNQVEALLIGFIA